MNGEPWKDEPDRLEWKHENGLDCLIVRGPKGALCGYAGVTEKHPMYGKSYKNYMDKFEVHGGLTYSKHCEGKVCHKTDDHESPTYWFGFDCGHHYDVCPTGKRGSEFFPDEGLMAELMEMADVMYAQPLQPGVEPNQYRDINYVKGQVNKLAVQLGEVA